MLNSFRNFSKSWMAKILLVIIIIPFVFWGMGGSFRSGGKNTVAKINNHNISTKDFMEYVNTLNLNPEIIRENINNSIIEQLLSGLISKNVLSLVSRDLDINLSDKALSQIIKNNKEFLDKNNQFSRTKYEKFLISNNYDPAFYEKNLKNEETNKLLLSYISGGTFSPKFLVKKTFSHQNKKLFIRAINLNSIYKKKKDFSEEIIKKYADNNIEQLKEDFMSFRYATINPLSLVNSDEFNEAFFKKIDEIDSAIINGITFEEITKNYNLKVNVIELINKDGLNENGVLQKNISKELVEKIFKLKTKKENSINLLEYENEYAIIITDKIKKTIQSIKSENFRERIVNNLIDKDKFEYNQKLMAKIKTNAFFETDFVKLAKMNNTLIEDIVINGIEDESFFSIELNKEIFKLPEKNFTIVHQTKKDEAFLIWLKKTEKQNLDKDAKNYNKYYTETLTYLKNDIYTSFDNYISQKYKVEINHQTLDRLKNYFR